MSELRKDYLFEEYVIISEKRGARPVEFKDNSKIEKDRKDICKKEESCFFCPGNEDKTPPEISRIGEKNWEFRVFPNKFPFVENDKDYKFKKKNQYLTQANAHGFQEVIVETPCHNITVHDFDQPRIIQMLKVYKERIKALSEKPGIKYVSILKNHGPKSGASLVHSHSQVIAYSMIPTLIKRKEEASTKKCPYCEILKIESKSERRCFENKNFVAFTPFASLYAYEIWVMPKKHKTDFNDFKESDYKDFSEILEKIFKKMDILDVDFNYSIQYGLENMHFHLFLTPRITLWGGFEIATETKINIVSPESAAKFYRSNS